MRICLRYKDVLGSAPHLQGLEVLKEEEVKVLPASENLQEIPSMILVRCRLFKVKYEKNLSVRSFIPEGGRKGEGAHKGGSGNG